MYKRLILIKQSKMKKDTNLKHCHPFTYSFVFTNYTFTSHQTKCKYY